jgi:ADP-ribosylglycohydrolase
MHKALYLLLLSAVVIVMASCRPCKMNDLDFSHLDQAFLYDKILGSLVGSAAGDAMGAPTEMWSRFQIQAEFGHVDSLTDMVREPSPEGTWNYNLHKGGSTDDTRWKMLTLEYVLEQKHPDPLSARDFAFHILGTYDHYTSGLASLRGRDPEPYEGKLMQMLWLKEWVKVAEAYVEDSLSHYDALSTFYGGEMVCAGMLFAPAVGLAYPGEAEYAYKQAYELDIYDQGYARDIAALTAAMVAEAMDSSSTPDSILAVLRTVDPEGYFKGRLVGRSAYALYRQAQYIVKEARDADVETVLKEPPVKLSMELNSQEDSIRYAQWSLAYAQLDKVVRSYPFHPAEIHLVNLVALLLCDFDFQQTLAFIVNFGRDNDTTAAVAGAILGAYYGYEALPEAFKENVLDSSKELGMDLEERAGQMVGHILGEV